MTPGMQFRLWYRAATPTQRLATFTAIAVVVTLLAASAALAPTRHDQPGTVAVASEGAAASPHARTADQPSGASTPGDASPSGPATATAGRTDGPTASGSAAPSGAADATATQPTPQVGGDAPATRTASDRGVTKDEIRIGFMLQNPGGLNGAGFSTGQRNDGPKYVQALAAWANRNGGAAGRKVTAVFRYTDPTSVEDQQAACRAFVDDSKVFGAVDVAAMLDTAALDCLTNRTKGDTPFVHSVMWSRDWQSRSGGNDVSYQAAIDRISVTWARDLGAMQWFPKGATVGILGDKCPATQPTIANVLAPALKRAGAADVVLGLHDCDIQSVVSQPPNIATQFRLKRVTHVLIVSNFVAGQVFVSSAASQGYKPKYSTSDWFLNTSNSTTQNFDPNQFDGAIGIASIGSTLAASGKPPYPGWETCSKIATDAGLSPIRPDDDASTEVLSLCDNFLLLLDALRASGPNPTRAGWRAAIANLGWRDSAVFGRSRFAPDKRTGSDFVHTVQWQRGCRCWRVVSDSRPAAA